MLGALVLPPALDEVASEHLVAIDVFLDHIEVLSPVGEGGSRVISCNNVLYAKSYHTFYIQGDFKVVPWVVLTC